MGYISFPFPSSPTLALFSLSSASLQQKGASAEERDTELKQIIHTDLNIVSLGPARLKKREKNNCFAGLRSIALQYKIMIMRTKSF